MLPYVIKNIYRSQTYLLRGIKMSFKFTIMDDSHGGGMFQKHICYLSKKYSGISPSVYRSHIFILSQVDLHLTWRNQKKYQFLT